MVPSRSTMKCEQVPGSSCSSESGASIAKVLYAAANVALLFYLVPPVTALMAYAMFGETLDAAALAGMGLIAVGVALARLRDRLEHLELVPAGGAAVVVGRHQLSDSLASSAWPGKTRRISRSPSTVRCTW